MQASERIPVPTKAAYGIGQAAEGMKNAVFGYFLLFYFSQLLGLPASLAGLSVLIALGVDAITDPLMGSISDRWKSSLGRRHPFMYASAAPLALTFFVLFAPPTGLSVFGLFVWMTIFGILARVSMTLFHVPHQALGAELSTDFGERTSIVQFRQALSIFGTLLAFVIGFGVFFTGDLGQRDTQSYPLYAATISLVMASCILVSSFGTHGRIKHLPETRDRATPFTLKGLFADNLEVLNNRSFRWFFGGVIVIFLMVGVDAALSAYMNTYFWEISRGQILLWLIAYPIGAIFGAFFTRRFHMWFDKKPMVMAGTSCWALCQIIPIVLFLMGWFPSAGTSELLIALIIVRLIQGFGTVQALVSAGAMIADIADEHDLNTGNRQEGVFFGALSFSGKVSTGLGNFVAGVALDLIAWPRGEHITVADVPASTIMWLGLIYGPIVSGFAVLSIYLYTHYNLTREAHQRVLVQLAERDGPGSRIGSPEKDAHPVPGAAE